MGTGCMFKALLLRITFIIKKTHILSLVWSLALSISKKHYTFFGVLILFQLCCKEFMILPAITAGLLIASTSVEGAVGAS